MAGCAGDTESYCAELEEQEQTLTDLASRADQPGTNVFTESLDVFEALRDAAPRDVVDEWDTLVFAWQGLADAFEAAGTTPTEFDPADPPRTWTRRRSTGSSTRPPSCAPRGSSRPATGSSSTPRTCGVDLGL